MAYNPPTRPPNLNATAFVPNNSTVILPAFTVSDYVCMIYFTSRVILLIFYCISILLVISLIYFTSRVILLIFHCISPLCLYFTGDFYDIFHCISLVE